MITFRTAGMSFDMPHAMSREQRIARIDAFATLLDTAFSHSGNANSLRYRALIRLVPGIGDVITTILCLYVVNEARALGAPPLLIARMIANVAFDGIVGAIPIVGDAIDVAFRANRRNIALLRAHLDQVEGRDAPYWSPRGSGR